GDGVGGGGEDPLGSGRGRGAARRGQGEPERRARDRQGQRATSDGPRLPVNRSVARGGPVGVCGRRAVLADKIAPQVVGVSSHCSGAPSATGTWPGTNAFEMRPARRRGPAPLPSG